MTPSPPACAIAMARRASATVSIAEEMMGMLSVMSAVSRVRRSTMFGVNCEWPGFSSTSSNVSAISMGGRGAMVPTPGGPERERSTADGWQWGISWAQRPA